MMSASASENWDFIPYTVGHYTKQDMLGSRTPDILLIKSRVPSAYATMPLRPLDTKIMSIGLTDLILALLELNGMFLSDCIILGFYICTIEFPASSSYLQTLGNKIMSLALIYPILALHKLYSSNSVFQIFVCMSNICICITL